MLDTFLVLLQVLFIALKLTNKIQWSWWLVLMPMIVYAFIYLFMLLLMAGFLVGLGLSFSSSY